MVEGQWLELGDGQKWAVPQLRLETGRTGLPRALRLSPDGQLVGDVVDKYRALAADGERLWQMLCHLQRGEPAPDPIMSEADIFRLVARVLSVNYRLGPAEVGALGLITSANFLRVAFAVVGYDRLLQVEESPPGE
jgi:hypothetical protein